jgi:hypothetical protein
LLSHYCWLAVAAAAQEAPVMRMSVFPVLAQVSNESGSNWRKRVEEPAEAWAWVGSSSAAVWWRLGLLV